MTTAPKKVKTVVIKREQIGVLVAGDQLYPSAWVGVDEELLAPDDAGVCVVMKMSLAEVEEAA